MKSRGSAGCHCHVTGGWKHSIVCS